MKGALHIGLVLGVLCHPAVAQDERRAAEQALDGLGPVTDSLTMGNMRDAVVPYAGTDVDEADLVPEDFDRAILDIWTGPGQDGRAYQSTLDSVDQRPDIDLGSDPLALADDAVENAEAALGGFFSADSGTCEAIFQDGSYDGVRLCNAILQREIETCEVWREISVDREDFWACEIAERDFTRTCNENITWSCTGSTGASCRRDRLRPDRPFTWRSSSTVMDFSLGQTTEVYACLISRERIVIDGYVGFDPSRFRVLDWRFTGIGQLRVNGENIYTTGTTSRGNLNLRYEDTGGKDGGTFAAPVVYAGNTRIDTCPYGAGTERTVGPIGLLSHVDYPTPGPSAFRANHIPYIPMGEHEEIVIELISVYYGGSRPHRMRLEVGGSCCSQITSDGARAC